MKYIIPGAGKDGFTLFEVLLVLVIFSLSLALVSIRLTGGQSELKARTTAKKIASTLKYARNRALRERTVFYVESFPDKLVVSPEASGAKKEIPLEGDVVIKPLEVATVVFYPSSGSSGGGFEVTDDKEKIYYLVKVDPSTGHVQIKAR